MSLKSSTLKTLGGVRLTPRLSLDWHSAPIGGVVVPPLIPRNLKQGLDQNQTKKEPRP